MFARCDPVNWQTKSHSHKFSALLAANELVECNFPRFDYGCSDKFVLVVFLVELESEGRVEVDIAQKSFLVVADEAYLLVETILSSSILSCKLLHHFECMPIHIWFRSIEIVLAG